MTLQLAIEFVEPKDDLLFVAGVGLTDLAVGQTFTAMVLHPAGKKKAQSAEKIALTIETLIVDGEPVENSASDASVLVALAGDGQPILEKVDALRWRRKSGRWLRTTQDVLMLTAP